MTEYIVDVTGLESGDYAIAREEIVRCRDCKYCMAYFAGAYCDYMAHSIEPEGFCAWASRKDERRES